MKGDGRSLIPSAAAMIAFAVIVLVFAMQISFFHDSTVGWARLNLESQALLASKTLLQPLREQDFKRIRQFGDDCRERLLHLQISSMGGGIVFDTRARRERSEDFLSSSARSGEYTVSLFLPKAIVEQPFRRAIPVLALSALLGCGAMMVVFFVLYRQRVKIRQLARLEKFRREFIADVSHEIKTPLTGIIAGTEILCENPGGENAPEVARMVCGQAQNLNALVERILNLSRLEREGMKLNLASVDLAAAIDALAKKYRCRFSSAAGVGEVVCDLPLIMSAVENLLVNAVKYSGSDEISVSLAKRKFKVVIAVEDHGVGIAGADRERVFDRFVRLDPSRAQATGGSGLGLAIVRRIARLHGGDAKVFPVSPRGARFVITFDSGIK